MEYLFLGLYILGKVLFGGYFMMNGYSHLKNLNAMTGYAQSKGVKWPKFAVAGTGVMLLLGGLGTIVDPFVGGRGIFALGGFALISIFLLVVTFKMHQFWKVSDPMQRMGEEINFYKNLALLGATLMLTLDIILLSQFGF